MMAWKMRFWIAIVAFAFLLIKSELRSHDKGFVIPNFNSEFIDFHVVVDQLQERMIDISFSIHEFSSNCKQQEFCNQIVSAQGRRLPAVLSVLIGNDVFVEEFNGRRSIHNGRMTIKRGPIAKAKSLARSLVKNIKGQEVVSKDHVQSTMLAIAAELELARQQLVALQRVIAERTKDQTLSFDQRKISFDVAGDLHYIIGDIEEASKLISRSLGVQFI